MNLFSKLAIATQSKAITLWFLDLQRKWFLKGNVGNRILSPQWLLKKNQKLNVKSCNIETCNRKLFSMSTSCIPQFPNSYSKFQKAFMLCWWIYMKQYQNIQNSKYSIHETCQQSKLLRIHKKLFCDQIKWIIWCDKK